MIDRIVSFAGAALVAVSAVVLSPDVGQANESGTGAIDDALCSEQATFFGLICSVINAHCLPFLDDPFGIDPTAIRPLPENAPSYLRGSELSQVILGYRETELDNVSVLFLVDEPGCELLIYNATYFDLIDGYRAWVRDYGQSFAATGTFEPTSRAGLDRAYAAVFLAAPRDDGRVTEITFNWNVNREGLTRLKISYQPPRDYTLSLMHGKAD